MISNFKFQISNSRRPLLGIALALSLVILASCADDHPAANPPPAAATNASARKLEWKVVHTYPHDPDAFLQGLLWRDGSLYESTGLEGHSTLRRVELDTGKVLKKIPLANDIFGEGLAVVSNRLVQLTWQSKKGFVYDLATFKLLREFHYETEGWGLASDGQQLVMSDGSDTLTWLDPNELKPLKTVAVKYNGRSLRNLNELEFIEGSLWANVWQTDSIVIIEPATGRVTGYLDLHGLLSNEMRTGKEDVLNGIAYDPERKRIFVGGKLWPKLFEIQVVSP